MSRFHKRHRRSIRKSAVGVTKVMKGVKRAAGITEGARPIRAPANARRRALQRAGQYRALMQLLRLLARLR
jgi:hypothetical protein